MKRSSCAVVAWLLLAAAFCFLLWKGPEPADSGSIEPGPVAGRPARTFQIRKITPALEPVRAEVSAGRRDDVLRDILSAVTTYSTGGVRPIAAHLLDSDPELREAARQGLIQLGEPDAIPLLRDAARRLDGAEATACMDAAAFLELPSWSDTEEARAVSAELSKPTPPP